MNAAQQKEVVALVTWLQTFPEFGVTLIDDQQAPNGDTLVQALDSLSTVR